MISYTVPKSATFKGNKSSLPSKPCVACGRAMSWRKRWARTWADVKYCSEACRRSRDKVDASSTGGRA